MLFHQPFMNALADAEPGCDMLLGKPMPIQAARRFYQELGEAHRFDPSLQLQWLIDSLPRLEQYLACTGARPAHAHQCGNRCGAAPWRPW